MRAALLNQVIPKLFGACALAAFVATYGLESLAPYYKLVAAFTFFQLFAEWGVPAQYQRQRKTSLDVMLFHRCVSQVALHSLIALIFAILLFPMIASYVGSGYLVAIAIVAILLRTMTAMSNAFLAKRHDHRGLLSINLIGSGINFAVWGGAYIFADWLGRIDLKAAVPLFFIVPILGRWIASACLVKLCGARLTVSPAKKFEKHKKIQQIRVADLVKSLLGTANNQLVIIFSSSFLNDSDLALLGVLVTWGNRLVLFFVSALKQITYPRLVDAGANDESSHTLVVRNYRLNLVYCAFLSLVTLTAVLGAAHDDASAAFLYTVFATFIFSTTPITDWLKAYGAFGVLLAVQTLKILVLACCVVVYSAYQDGQSLLGLLSCLVIYGFLSHLVDCSLFYWLRRHRSR